MRASLSMSDTITPGLRKKIRAVADPRPVLEAMGLQLLSLTQDSFNSPARRAAPWPNKVDGKPATLRRNQALFKAWRIGKPTKDSITVENDRPYAAIHQLGGKTKPHENRPKTKKALAWPGGPGPVKKVNHPGSRIPARPMVPFLPTSGATAELAPFARDKLQKIAQKKLEALLK